MNTRSLAARLKRLEFRLHPCFVPPQIVICLVDSKAQVLCKMRLGPGENPSPLTTSRLRKRKPTACVRLQQLRICHESHRQAPLSARGSIWFAGRNGM